MSQSRRRNCTDFFPLPAASKSPMIASTAGRMLAADHAGVLAGLHELALGLVGFLPVDRRDDAILLVFELRIERIVLTQDDGDDGQVVLAGELEVALVAARDGHNRAGAVVGHDVVGDPHGDLLAVHGVHDVAAGERAVLLAVALGALDGAHLGSGLHESHDFGLVFGAGDELGHELAFGSEQEEAASEERVGARREHGNRLGRLVFALGGTGARSRPRRLPSGRSSWPASASRARASRRAGRGHRAAPARSR